MSEGNVYSTQFFHSYPNHLKQLNLYGFILFLKDIIMYIPHLFIFKFVMNVCNVILRGGGALSKQCFKHPPFQHSKCVCFHQNDII